MAWLNKVRLPSDFQEVEWIGNSGTQYIDTGVAIPNHKVIVHIEYTALNSWMSIGGYLGQDSGVPGGHVRLYAGYAGNTGQWAYGFLNSHAESGGSVATNTKYELEVSTISGNMYFKHDGTTYGSSSSTYSTSLTSNFGICGQNGDGGQTWSADNSDRVYDYKIYDSSNNLVRDFVPCYRKSDSVIGMYDLVNGVFYTNAGTGTFNKGNDVPDMIEEQIYPEGWKPGKNTVAYYPFRSDILDHSGNNNNFTGSGYSFSNNMITTTSELIGPIVTPENTIGDRTINIWCNRNNVAGYSFRGSNNGTDGYLNAKDGENGNRPGASFKTSSWYRNRPSASDLPAMGNVILMTWTKTGDTMKLYIDGVLTSTTTLNTSTRSSSYGITKSSLSLGTFGEIIIEDKIRTPDEIEKYYNDTKRIYNPPIKPWKVNEHTVAYYPLEENVNDYSGNANHGSGNPNSFDGGVANYSGNSTTLPYSIINRNVYTVNVWAYANSTETTGNRRFLGQHTSSSRGFNLGYIKNSGINYQTGPNSNTTTSADYVDSSVQGWHLITGVTDGTNMYLYVDGELKDTDTFTGNNGQTLYMGYDHGYNGYAWNGKLSELIVEDIVWEPRKIEKYYNDTKEKYLGSYTPGVNTLGYRPMKEDLNDYSGNNHNWSITRGSVSYSNNMATINTIRIDSLLFTGTGDFTMQLYMQTNDTNFAYNIWSDTTWNPRCMIVIEGIGLWNTNWYGVNETADTSLALRTFVRQNNIIYYYKNGTLIGSNSNVPSTNISGGYGLYIGGNYNTNTSGTVGAVILENRAWTQSEIQAYYNQTKSNYGL